MRIKVILCASLAALMVAGCGGGGSSSTVAAAPPPPPPPPPVTTTEREIAPNLTSAGVTTHLTPHTAINPDASAARGRLFVMLPGTTLNPRAYRLIVRRGAQRGFHTIGLTYPNDEAVAELCVANGDAACAGAVRREIITGTDSSPLVSVNAANSITGRLASLLSYLSTTFPNEGWGQFLSGGRPNWALITVGGHSQGAGHAGFLAKLEVLDRAVMFSGPAERLTPSGQPATWLSDPNVTPVSRQYGFSHTADGLVPLALLTTNWARIGLDASGPQVSVDGNAAPYGGSHQLLTSAAPNPNPGVPVGDSPHGAPVIDVVTPLDAQGLPIYRTVWDYLAFP